MSDSGSLEGRKPLQIIIYDWSLDHDRVQAALVLFTDTEALNGEANGSVGTLATVLNTTKFTMVEVTSVTIAMGIYHTSCPAGPQYDKSHSHLHLGV